MLVLSIAALAINAAPGKDDQNSGRTIKKESGSKRAPCMCPRIWWPVCGTDNVTYG